MDLAVTRIEDTLKSYAAAAQDFAQICVIAAAGAFRRPQPPLPDGAVLSGRGDTADITGVASSATATLQNADQTLRKLKRILTGINSGKGTAGKLVNQDQLYKRADKVLSEVEGLITDIKKNPTRYLKFSVF